MRVKRSTAVKSKSKKRRARALQTQAVPEAASAPAVGKERLFDEPATPPRRSVVPVEEPIEPPKRTIEPDVCGDPDAARTEASDLH
jgi:hypothetical protein